MSLNFLENDCQEPARTEVVFGICDDQGSTKAYTDIDEQDSWIATVKNEQAYSVIFTAIDKCLIKNHEFPGRGRCDGMLTTDDHLYFVELQRVRKDWIEEAVNQLESTIKFFKENHIERSFRYRKAFACNRRHQYFQKIDNEDKLSFRQRTGFRLDIQATIKME